MRFPGTELRMPAGQAFEFAIGFDLPIGKLIENNLGFVNQQDLIDATVDLLNAEEIADDAVVKPSETPVGE